MNLNIELPKALADVVSRDDDGYPRVYPDVAPMACPMPYITFTTVGGQSVTTFCASARVNTRVQFNVWATTRLEADRVMDAIARIVTEPPFRAVPQGEPAAEYDQVTKDRGTRQDFSFWTPRTHS